MKSLYIFSFVLVLSHFAGAQHTIRGTVKANGEPADFAQVYVKELSGRILSYTFTDSLGTYVISFETTADSLLLHAARLGYNPFEQLISSTGSDLDITLTPSDKNTLREVIISEGKPVEVEGDTVRYFAQTFGDGSEKSVEDLLAKLPGISVDEVSGTIKYQGKAIKKIMLDGDDLAGDNYKVLSKNLSAHWLEEVEVLKHFTENRLLQGIRKSDEVAINLKLKEEAKAPLFGAAGLGGGTTSKYSAEAELLSYLKKWKILTLGEVNNTGVDLQSYELSTYTSSQLEYKGFVLPDPVLSHQLSPPDFFKQERFTFHEGKFLSNSFVTKPSSNISVRSVTTLYDNTINFNFLDSISYFQYYGDDFIYVQNRRQAQKPFELFQDLKTEITLSERQDLIVSLQNKYLSNGVSTLNIAGLSKINDNSDAETYEWFGGVSYTQKLNRNWVNSSDIELGEHYVNERFQVSGKKSPVDSIDQSTRQNFLNIGVFNRLEGIVNQGWRLSLLTGWSETRSYFTYIQNKLRDDTSIYDKYKFDNLFAEFKLDRKIKSANFSMAGRVKNAAIKYNDQLSNHIYFEPTISASTKNTFGAVTSEINGLYNIEYVFLKPGQLISKPLLTSFRQATWFQTNSATPLRNSLGVLTVKLAENNVSYLTANAEWGYLQSDATIVRQVNFVNEAVISHQVQGGRLKNFFSIYSIDKYFSHLKSTIKLAYNYDILIAPLAIEQIAGESKLTRSLFSISSGSAVTRQLNLSMAIKLNTSVNQWKENANGFRFTNYYSKLVYNPIRSLRITFDYQQIRFADSNERNDILNASAHYTAIEDKLSLELTANNILNRNALVLSSVEPSLISASLYPFQPRFFMVTAQYRF